MTHPPHPKQSLISHTYVLVASMWVIAIYSPFPCCDLPPPFVSFLLAQVIFLNQFFPV
jgi:hypothetical protein